MFYPSAGNIEKAERAFYEYLGLAWAKMRGVIQTSVDLAVNFEDQEVSEEELFLLFRVLILDVMNYLCHFKP